MLFCGRKLTESVQCGEQVPPRSSGQAGKINTSPCWSLINPPKSPYAVLSRLLISGSGCYTETFSSNCDCECICQAAPVFSGPVYTRFLQVCPVSWQGWGWWINFTLAPLPSSLRSSGFCWSLSRCSSTSRFPPSNSLPLFFFAHRWMFSSKFFFFFLSLSSDSLMSEVFLKSDCKQGVGGCIVPGRLYFFKVWLTDYAMCFVLSIKVIIKCKHLLYTSALDM